MCFGGENESTTTTSSGLPQNVKELSDKLAKKAGSFLDSEYTAYEGDRVADLNSQQNSAIAGFENHAANNPVSAAAGTARNYLTRFANAGPNTIGSSNIDGAGGYEAAKAGQLPQMTAATADNVGSVVDENGPLGSIQNYMDPHIKNVLQGTIDEIDKSGQRENNRIGNMAAASHAFGDARHGILEAENRKNVNDAISDAANRTYSNAFNNAMSLRTGDINRMQANEQFNAGNQQQANMANTQAGVSANFANMNAENAARQFGATMDQETQVYNAESDRARDIYNAGANESALARLYQSASGLMSNATAEGQSNLDAYSALLGAGNLRQGNAQARLDADYEAYLREYQHPYDLFAGVTGVAAGIPYERTQTTTSRQPDNSGYGLVGGLVSSFF